MKKRLKGRKRNVILAAVLASAMMLVYTGCGSAASFENKAVNGSAGTLQASPEMSEDMAYDSGMGMTDAAFPEEEMKGTMDSDTAAENGETQAAQAQTDRKLIKTVNMDVETKEFDKVMSSVEDEVTALGGYIENSNTYNGSKYATYRDRRYADMKIRIPKQSLDAFINTVSEVSNVTRRSDNVEDITLTYVDLASHRDALRIEQSRLLELLEKAETLEDILTIENRLSDVRYQLESMESQLRTLDNQVDYSTVYLNVSEVEVFTPVEEETTWERISEGFMRSLENIGEDMKESVISFIINLPYLIGWAIVIFIFIFVTVKMIRRSNRIKAARAAEAQSHSTEESKKE